MSQRVCCSHSCLRTYLVAKCGCDVGPEPGVEPRAMRRGPPRPSTGLAVSHDLRMMCTDNTIDVYCDRCAEIVQMRAGDIPEGDVEIEVNNKEVCTLSAGPAEYKLNGLAAEEFPPLPKFKESQSLRLPQERMRDCLLYTSPSPRDRGWARMPSSA